MKKAVLLLLCLALLLTVTSCSFSGKFVTVQYRYTYTYADDGSKQPEYSDVTINCEDIVYIEHIPDNDENSEYAVIMTIGLVYLNKEEVRKVYQAIGVAMP